MGGEAHFFLKKKKKVRLTKLTDNSGDHPHGEVDPSMHPNHRVSPGHQGMSRRHWFQYVNARDMFIE